MYLFAYEKASILALDYTMSAIDIGISRGSIDNQGPK
jgi:hypothetical protein